MLAAEAERADRADPVQGRTVPSRLSPLVTGPTVAIMQPYLFPYLGYFCLARASDVLVFYDDVHHMPRGWVHRNRILINGAPYRFTVPLCNGSQNTLIRDLEVHDLAQFRRGFLRQLECAYRRAPCFETGIGYVRRVLDTDTTSLPELTIRAIEILADLLGLSCRFLRSSEAFAASRGAERAARLIDITRALGARRYVNAIGGAGLYDKDHFDRQGVQLAFVNPRLRPYAQMGSEVFIPGLSIIDVLMHNELAQVAAMTLDFELS